MTNSPKPKGKLPNLVRLEAYLANHGASMCFLYMILMVDICIIWWGVWEFLPPWWTTKNDVLRITLPIARGAGRLISFNSALILLSASKYLWTLTRKTPLHRIFPVDKIMPYYHKLLAWSLIVAGLIIHTIPQIVNYATESLKLPGYPGVWSYGKGMCTLQLLITGIILCVCFAAFFVTTLDKVRRNTWGFRIFWACHVVSILLTFPALIIHGTIKGTPITLWFVIGPLVIYVIDVILRRFLFKHRTASVLHARAHMDGGEKVTRLTITRTDWNFRPGQYCDIRIPALSPFEWHPFTIASAPDSEDEVTFFIKALGKWTNSLWDMVQQQQGDIDKREDAGPQFEVNIRGPFGAPAMNYTGYSHILMVGTGIGVTPLLSVWLHLTQNLEKYSNQSLRGQSPELLSPDELISNLDQIEDNKIEATIREAHDTSLRNYCTRRIIAEADITFTDIFNFVEVNEKNANFEKDPTRFQALACAFFESLTINVFLFLTALTLTALNVCLWLGDQNTAAEVFQIICWVVVVIVYVPKIILSTIVYGSRYLRSTIFIFELFLIFFASVSLAFDIMYIVSPSRFDVVGYFVAYGVYLFGQLIRIMYILYSSARPGSGVMRSGDAPILSTRGIWVNKNIESMAWALPLLVSSVKSLPDSYGLDLYATRENREELKINNPFTEKKIRDQLKAQAQLKKEKEKESRWVKDFGFDSLDDQDADSLYRLRTTDKVEEKTIEIPLIEKSRKANACHAGRPDWQKIFTEAITRAHNSGKDGMAVGVFYCGSPAVARELRAVATKVTAEHSYIHENQNMPCKCRVVVHKENF